jgi:integrase
MEIIDIKPEAVVDAPQRREIDLRQTQPGEATSDPYRVYLEHFDSMESRLTMAACLDRITRLILLPSDAAVGMDELPHYSGAGRAWWLLRRADAMEIRARFTDTTGTYGAPTPDGYSPAYINKHLSALRGVIKECWSEDLISTDDYMKIKEIPNVKGSRTEAGRSIEPREMAALLAECAKAPNEATRLRDTAIILVLQSTGMRRAELAGALIERYDRRERHLQVIGKGKKGRKVWINKRAIPALEAWLSKLGRTGPMFPAINRYGKIQPRAIGPGAVNDIVERYRVRAKLAPLSPHDFRRTVIGDYFDAKADSQQARKIAGHAQSSTTDKYDRRGDRGLRALTDKLPIVLPGEEVHETEESDES